MVTTRAVILLAWVCFQLFAVGDTGRPGRIREDRNDESELHVKRIPRDVYVESTFSKIRDSRSGRRIQHSQKDVIDREINRSDINNAISMNKSSKVDGIRSTLLRRVNESEAFGNNKTAKVSSPTQVLCETSVIVPDKYSNDSRDFVPDKVEHEADTWFGSIRKKVQQVFHELTTITSDDVKAGEARSEYDSHSSGLKKKKKKKIIWKFLLKAFVVVKVMLASLFLPPVLTFSTMLAKKAFILSIMAFFLAKIAVFRGIVKGHHHDPVVIASKWTPHWDKRGADGHHFHVAHSHQFHHHALPFWSHYGHPPYL